MFLSKRIWKKINKIRFKICAVPFRQSGARNDLINESALNTAIRVYLYKNTFSFNLKDKELKAKSMSVIDSVHKSLYKIYTENGENAKNLIPGRVDIYFHPEDEFFSIVFGFKCSKKIPAADLKIAFFLNYFEQNNNISDVIPFFVSNYETHNPVSSLDIDHIGSGPFEKLHTREVLEFLTSLTEFQTIVNNETKPSFVRSKKSKKTVSDVAEEGGGTSV